MRDSLTKSTTFRIKSSLKPYRPLRRRRLSRVPRTELYFLSRGGGAGNSEGEQEGSKYTQAEEGREGFCHTANVIFRDGKCQAPSKFRPRGSHKVCTHWRGRGKADELRAVA